ncbi:MAG: cytochrome C oxidase subunit IV family protein [bacterium]|nr:cytochrome C oxidase subunit IV family protein [bacterium]
MKSDNNSSKTKHDGEHGTMRSYVIGYALSLIFTVIPFYLVVNETIRGTQLLVTILGFAFIQMLIQIFFFLHLGRGPKPFYNIVFFGATVSAILVVVGGSVFIMNNLYYNMTPDEATTRLAEDEGIAQIGGEETGACQGLNDNHKVTIKDGVMSPALIEARRCDTLTFTNEDSKKREITFGIHPNHDSYGGEFEVVLSGSKPKSITLNQTGYYAYHDHLDPDAKGNFLVSE